MKYFNVTLKKSTIGCTKTQIETVRCLGLKRLHHTVKVNDTPANRGQIYKVQHMVEVQIGK
jgi:large subunit ribosomal protein L30